MEKLTLVIMAAGMGSRYGGLKQIDPVDKDGHIIMDFSIYDAVKAGFNKVVFIIKKENEKVFREAVGDRVSEIVETAYAFQAADDLPEGYELPEEREKPWGTGQALLCAAGETEGPCAVINADDYYGPEAFSAVADYLRKNHDGESYRYAMAGFLLKNTLTDHGSVSRGVCRVDESGFLTGITERTCIEKRENGPAFRENNSWTALPENSIVSMNMWGFTPSIFKELKNRFPLFLDKALAENPLKAEFFLPFVVDELLQEKKAEVKVLKTSDKWYGVTYKEDKPVVCEAIRRMEEEKKYVFG